MKTFALLLSAAAAIIALSQPRSTSPSSNLPTSAKNTRRGIGIEPGHRMLTVSGLTVSELIQRTYSIQESQISGTQSWMNSDRFDITAKIERETAPSTEELWRMLEAVAGGSIRAEVSS